jgi:hypothetical protein
MKVKWSEPVESGIRFGINPKEWLHIFIVDMVFLSAAFMYFYPRMGEIINLFSAGSSGAPMFLSVLGHILTLAAIFILWLLVMLWLDGVLIHQSWKGKEPLKNSWNFSAAKYITMIAAWASIGLISVAISIIPFVGWFLSIVASWVFLFTFIKIITSDSGFYESIVSSYEIFRKNPLEVVLAWLITSIIGGLIMLAFIIIPLIMLSASIAQSGLSVTLMNTPLLVSSVILFSIGNAISRCFIIKSLFGYYRQFTKKLPF